MPSTSDTGHAKNVANFATLHSYCTGYGSMYNPSRDAIKVSSLLAMLNSGRQVLDECMQKKTVYDAFVDVRKDAFAPLRSLSTRVVNALVASGVSPTVIDSARTINRKMTGARAKPLPTPATDAPAPKTNSVSQQSFDSLVEHFSALVELVGSYPEYAPNEALLQKNTLLNQLDQLRKANKDVMDAFTDWSNARISRSNLLYGEGIGMVDIALAVKQYVRSVFGASSPNYKQISGLQFKRYPES